MASMPLVFEENVGQAPESIHYLSRGRGYALGLSGVETTLSLRGAGSAAQNAHAPLNPKEELVTGSGIDSVHRSSPSKRSGASVSPSSPSASGGATIKMSLVGANSKAKSQGEQQLKAKINYFVGNDPKGWHTDVPAFERVRTASVYPGIDVLHYGKQTGQLEYDFVVAGGADPSRIRFTVEGAEKVRIAANGDLVLSTPAGELRQERPVCYQELEGKRVPVEGAFVLTGASADDDRSPTSDLQPATDNSVSFRLGAYDAAHPLIIDPVLNYSTYLGGGAEDFGYGIATDSTGKAYVTGTTASINFPTNGEYHLDRAGFDAFVTVLDTTAVGAASLLYSTYLGGGLGDFGQGIATDGAGKAYVTGFTDSINFPTQGQFQADQIVQDVFVTVLDTTEIGAASLLYSTYLGGLSNERGFGIATDGNGRAYVAGYTDSANYPTLNQFQTELLDFNRDAVVTVLDTTETGAASMIYSTYLGGNGEDVANGIATDSTGKAYVTGYTRSTDFPTLGQYQTDPGDVAVDSFVSVLDPALSGVASLNYSTYVGGSSNDFGTAIAADGAGNAFITGYTFSTNLPTLGQYQLDPGDSNWDAFVSVLDTTTTGVGSLVYGTYLGGAKDDYGYGIAASSGGLAFVTGYTVSTNFPTQDPLQSDPGDTNADAFVTVLDTNLTGAASLAFSTYLGGGAYDQGWAIAANDSGDVFVAGQTSSTNFPTQDQFQSDPGDSNSDAFVTVLDWTLAPAAPAGVTATATKSTRVEVTWTDLASTETGYSVERSVNGGGYSPIATPGAVAGTGGTGSTIDEPVASETTYRYRVSSTNSHGASTGIESANVTTLAAPTGVSAMVSGASSIDITWTDQSAFEDGFRIYRKRNAGAFTLVHAHSAGAGQGSVLTWSNTGVSADGAYVYQVTAYGVASESDRAASPSVAFLSGPSNLTATAVTATRINLAWTDNATTELGFKIERKTGTGNFKGITSIGANKTAYADTGLPPGTTYTYRVRSYNGSGHSGYSNEDDATTLTPPLAPSNLVATAVTSTRIDLNWADNSTDETNFRIDRKTGSGSFGLLASVQRNITTYVDINGLTPETDYTYRLRSVSAGGFSVYSNEDGAITPAVPLAPSGMVATAVSATRIDLTWADNSSDESGFKIDRKAGAGNFKSITSIGANKTAYGDTGLLPGTTYTYRVRSYNGNGHSVYSNEDGATTPALPAAPTNLNATAISSSRIDLTWTDNATDESGFRIERKTGAGNFSLIASRGANVTSFSNTTGLAANTTYTYRIRAYNGNGNSAYSNEDAATTPAPPSRLSSSQRRSSSRSRPSRAQNKPPAALRRRP